VLNKGKVMIDKKQIIIIGAGGHGYEVYSYIQDLIGQGMPIRIVGFIDECNKAGPLGTTQILGNFDALEAFLNTYANSTFYYITAVGHIEGRRKLVQRVENLNRSNLQPWILRHPSVMVGQDTVIGAGTCLAPGCIITSRVSIGQHCILNVNSSVSHDCQIEDFVNINPRVTIAGNVKIGRESFIGIGATLIERVTIGEGAVIGAGAVVISNIPAKVTAVGVPARVIKQNM
jgi:sugar O-acyltransferase (sialic acid O-acetyltransferase NeuD family)